MNVGEEIVIAYLQNIKGCEFIQQNLYTPDVQGEIDVVGIDLESKTLYVCEVAVHLITGLLYTKHNKPNNVNKLTEKFSRDIEYANKYFQDYEKHFMFWTPIVRVPRGKATYNQMRDIEEITANIKVKYGIDLDCIINSRFLDCLNELRAFARMRTENLQSPILRYLQIEEYLKTHIARLPVMDG
jgi:Holliday junction resolvase-like predicted endonuclease